MSINSLTKEETKVIKAILKEELTKALSQLQVLDSDMSDDNFLLQAPDNYSIYQRLFLAFVIEGIHDAAEELADDGSGDSKVQA